MIIRFVALIFCITRPCIVSTVIKFLLCLIVLLIITIIPPLEQQWYYLAQFCNIIIIPGTSSKTGHIKIIHSISQVLGVTRGAPIVHAVSLTHVDFLTTGCAKPMHRLTTPNTKVIIGHRLTTFWVTTRQALLRCAHSQQR